ncbi:hypothetical protein DNTS_033022 [Danionella cerebrum]|nr:hypothetical protein DNTS_033022 [Danionella translucida]
MSAFKEALKEGGYGKRNSKFAVNRKKEQTETEKDSRVMEKARLPLIGSSSGRSAVLLELKGMPTPQHPAEDTRQSSHHPSSSGPPDSMAPWEGSSHSESSFSDFPPPFSPIPVAHLKPIAAPDPLLPPQPPPKTQPESSHSARVKRKSLPPRQPPRPPRLPPLRQVTNLSFSRSFTFSFFELPVHQSARSRAERLKDLTVLLKQFHY